MDKPPTSYVCAVCGSAVLVHGEKVVRSCAHSGAKVIANIAATAYGEGKVK